ncbi:hypothetical protein NM688_g8177 [Phlebia brevispora]|uniref:Uncharacterized protein n=1 Tax=Phlebia brevispora TaxID=194682 RepID=A0ACC1RWA7_9APHY|nr:hypothetical protein NM688_g8177 [Phlebia brevispora]
MLGRSPRMMYHAESFARNGFETYIIGNRGTEPIPSLLTLPVQLLYLPDPPKPSPSIPFILTAPLKVFTQVFSILDALLVRIPLTPEFILVQNPPSIPTLALVWLVSRLRGSKVIIDWHNLGYSILALKLRKGHPLVEIARRFEAYFGRCAYAHLFVTQAMRDKLVKEWQLQGQKIVLHDRPPAHFHRASASEMHELFVGLQKDFSSPSLRSFLPECASPYSTPFTNVPALPADGSDNVDFDVERDSPMPSARPDRPALLVSRKGPDREKYMRQVEQLQRGSEGRRGWEYVRCVSMWLKAADYPLMLGSADVGISLHLSSSGLDLPMKVVDMFGCGLPVCARNFACLDELVKDGINGLVFEDAEQLSKQLVSLLTGFPSSPKLDSLRASLLHATPVSPSQRSSFDDLSSPPASGSMGKTNTDWEWCSWTQNWNKVMRPLLLTDVASGQSL